MRWECVVNVNNTFNLTIGVRRVVVVCDWLDCVPVGVRDGVAGLPARWGFLYEEKMK